MKIPGGGSPFHNIRQPQSTSKANSSKGVSKGKGKGKAGQASQIAGSSATSLLDQVEQVDSPIYDVMAQESQRFENGEADLEEATRAVVSAMLKQHLGKTNLPEKALDEIANTVSSSITGDKTLSERLELALRRVAKNEKKRTEQNDTTSAP